MKYTFDDSDPSIMMVRTENFDAKETSKFQILSYKIVTYLKRELRACTMRIYQEKMKISANKKKFQIFFNFLHILVAPQKLYCSICNKFRKRNFLNGSSWTSKIV